MSDAMIGVIGTLLGTMLGWILANIRVGKIIISITDFEEKPHYVGSLESYPGKKTNELLLLEMSCTVQMYNAAQIGKAVRNCELVFVDAEGKELLSIRGQDRETLQHHRYGYTCDNIEVVNIEPHASKNVKLLANIDDIDAMHKIKTVYFRYKTERLKTKIIKYKEIDFNRFPRFCKTETEDLG